MPGLNDLISAPSSFEMAISSPVRKALIKYWGNEDIVYDPEIIVDLGPENISRINRIGRKSLHQIADALETFGYIESPNLWLRRKNNKELPLLRDTG